MKRKVIQVSLSETTGCYPISGESTLNYNKGKKMEMFTGIEPGFVTVYVEEIMEGEYITREVGIPIANCRGIVWEPQENNKK